MFTRVVKPNYNYRVLASGLVGSSKAESLVQIKQEMSNKTGPNRSGRDSTLKVSYMKRVKYQEDFFFFLYIYVYINKHPDDRQSGSVGSGLFVTEQIGLNGTAKVCSKIIGAQ